MGLKLEIDGVYVLSWKEAFENNRAPMVVLEATNEKTLDVIPMEDLISYAYKRLS